MLGEFPRRWHLASALLLVALAGLAAELIAATSKSVKNAANEAHQKIVFPPDRAVLLSGNLDVIYRGDEAELKVNSQAVPWQETYEAPIHVGHLHLSPGIHRLKIGDRQRLFCVALNEMEHDGPSEWKLHHVHTMSNEKDRCAECHDTATSNGRIAVKKALVPNSCTSCHTTDEIGEAHERLSRPLESCDACHRVHGSPYEFLLRAPKAKILEKYGAEK